MVVASFRGKREAGPRVPREAFVLGPGCPSKWPRLVPHWLCLPKGVAAIDRMLTCPFTAFFMLLGELQDLASQGPFTPGPGALGGVGRVCVCKSS